MKRKWMLQVTTQKYNMILLTFMLILAMAVPLRASYMSAYDINASNFPIVSAKFYALDDDMDKIENLSPSDVEVYENGEQRTVLSVSCPPVSQVSEISSVLTIDVSGSMGGGRLAIAKQAAKAWIDGLKVSSNFECCITSFNGSNFFNQDFTNDKTLLRNAVDKLRASGGTSFDAAFLNPVAGGLIALEKAKYNNVMILLTDGHAGGNEQKIIQKANEIGAVVYCVTLGMPCPPILQNIAYATGGKYYENVTTEDEAIAVYREIMMTSYNNQPCEVEWESAISCKGNQRNVVIKLPGHGLSANLTYTLEDEYVSKLAFDPASVVFSKTSPGETKSQEVMATATNGDFDITKIVGSNSVFEISPQNIIIKDGETKKFTVTFTPVDSGFTFTKFEMENTLCPVALYANGGFPGVPPSSSSLKLTYPNGGEVFAVGQQTEVTWEGVPPNTEVSLEYSTDEGANWSELTSAATSGTFEWPAVSDTPSNRCLMKVNQGGSTGMSSVFTKHDDTVISLAWSPDDMTIVASDYGSGTEYFFAATDASLLKTAMVDVSYAVSWSPDGSLVAIAGNKEVKIIDASTLEPVKTLSFSGSTFRTVYDVAFSHDGTKIAAGHSENGCRIWNTETWDVVFDLEANIKEPIRSIAWSANDETIALAGTSTIYWFDAEWNYIIHNVEYTDKVPHDVCYSPDGKFCAFAYSAGEVEIWDTEELEIANTIQAHGQSVNSIAWSPMGSFFATASDDGTVKIWDANALEPIYIMDKHSDAVNCVEWSHNGIYLASGSADTDVRVFSMACQVLQSDVSDAVWSIIMPEVSAIDVDMGNAEIGNTNTQMVLNFIDNTGTAPVRINNITISGADASEFSVTPGFAPMSTSPGNAYPVEFNFTPKSVGSKSAEITIYHQAGTIVRTIIGTAREQVVAVNNNIIDFGLVQLGQFKDTLQVPAITNNGSTPLVITKTEHNLPNDIDFTTLKGGGPFELQPGQTAMLDLRFNPSNPGRTSGSLEFYYEGSSQPATVYLFGEGFGEIPKDSCDETGFEYPDFTDPTNLYLVRNAGQHDDFIRLTPASVKQLGAMWYNRQIPVRDGFTTEFRFRMSHGSNEEGADEDSEPGADGIAFVVQNSDNKDYGSTGGGIGYSGIGNGIAVEFDLFCNDEKQIANYNDPNGNHVALMSMGSADLTVVHSEESTMAINDTILEMKSDGTIYYAKIDYNVVPDTIRVFLSDSPSYGEPVIQYGPVKLDELLDLDADEWAWTGMTSGTGASTQNHDILSWYFCPMPTNNKPAVEMPGAETKSDIYTYQSGGIMHLVYTVDKPGRTDITVFDLMGKPVHHVQTAEQDSGTQDYSLPMLAKGTYYYVVRERDKTRSGKIIIDF